jgi:hypothetical protein
MAATSFWHRYNLHYIFLPLRQRYINQIKQSYHEHSSIFQIRPKEANYLSCNARILSLYMLLFFHTPKISEWKVKCVVQMMNELHGRWAALPWESLGGDTITSGQSMSQHLPAHGIVKLALSLLVPATPRHNHAPTHQNTHNSGSTVDKHWNNITCQIIYHYMQSKFIFFPQEKIQNKSIYCK